MYDNEALLALAADLVLHEWTKHVEFDCYFIRDHVQSGTLLTSYIPSNEKILDIITKILVVQQHQNLLGKLGSSGEPPSLAWGGVLRWQSAIYPH